MKKVQVGDPAPDFTWAARSGEHVRLSEVRNEQVVVLFFYPRDGSVICTTYVIDKAGIVRLVFSAPMMADRHVSEALRVVGELVRGST